MPAGCTLAGGGWRGQYRSIAPRTRVSDLKLFDVEHRGMLLDAMVFLVNVLAALVLAGPFQRVVSGAFADDPRSMFLLLLYSIALFVLAPAGATLKRWHFHRRRGDAAPEIEAPGCLFNPIMYFCLVAVIFSAINAFIMQEAYGTNGPNGTVFAISLIAGIALMIAHVWLVFRFFSPPHKPPASAFMRSAASEVLGDACLFTNMLLFQLIWNAMSFAGVGAPGGVVEAILRLLVFVFLALLLYFPPRMFYLAEDINRGRTWAMILLANGPVIARLVFGSR